MIREMITGIYKIQSKIKPDRIYVGSAIDFLKREKHHFKDLKNNIHHSGRLQSHYNKYGVDDLYFETIEQCERDLLIDRENYYLKLLSYDGENKPWFNMCPTANNCLGLKASDVAKSNISKALKGKPKYYSEEEMQKLRNRMMGNSFSKGRVLSEETKRKIGASNRGRKYAPEIVEKNRQSHLGKIPWNKGLKGVVAAWNKGRKGCYKRSEQAIEKFKQTIKERGHPFKGKHHSEETRRKISESLQGRLPAITGRHHSEESKLKISLAHKGKRLTLEHRQHLSLAGIGRVVSEESKRKISESERKTKAELKSRKLVSLQ